MNLKCINPFSIHFPISFRFMQRFLPPSAKTRRLSEGTELKDSGFLSGELHFFENSEELDAYMRDLNSD
jgi:hypothetical protein